MDATGAAGEDNSIRIKHRSSGGLSREDYDKTIEGRTLCG